MSNLIILLPIVFLLSTVCGFVFIPIVIDFCKKYSLYDLPNSRKVHKDAIPRLGGICFLPCMFVTFVIGTLTLNYVMGEKRITVGMWTIMLALSLLMIYVVGVLDDIIGLGPRIKFVFQIVAAILLPASGLYINDLYGLFGFHAIPSWIGMPLTVFIMVFVNNAMNLIDGIDGLAAGLTLLSLTGFMFCFIHDGMPYYAIFIVGLMGILCSYLYFNVWGDVAKGHKIFMGDSGSLTLGFVLGFLLIKYSMNNPYVMPYRSNALLVSYTLLIVPCFDVVRVSCVRLLRRKPLFRADKTHIHHRLMSCGLTQHQTLVVILMLSVLFFVLNTLLYRKITSTEILFVDIVVFSVFHIVLDLLIKRRKRLQLVERQS